MKALKHSQKPRTIASIIGEREDSLIEDVRALISEHTGRMEQEMAQRVPPSPVEMRRIEWKMATRIVERVNGFRR